MSNRSVYLIGGGLFAALIVGAWLSQRRADLESHRDDLVEIRGQYEEAKSRLDGDIKIIGALKDEMRHFLQDTGTKSEELHQELKSIESRLRGSEELSKAVGKMEEGFHELKREVRELEEARRGTAR